MKKKIFFQLPLLLFCTELSLPVNPITVALVEDQANACVTGNCLRQIAKVATFHDSYFNPIWRPSDADTLLFIKPEGAYAMTPHGVYKYAFLPALSTQTGDQRFYIHLEDPLIYLGICWNKRRAFVCFEYAPPVDGQEEKSDGSEPFMHLQKTSMKDDVTFRDHVISVLYESLLLREDLLYGKHAVLPQAKEDYRVALKAVNRLPELSKFAQTKLALIQADAETQR